MSSASLERGVLRGQRLTTGELPGDDAPLSRAVSLDRGDWDPPRTEPVAGHLGYLIIDGLMLREVHVLEEWSVELLGPGDLLRPWLEDAASFVRPRWRVPEPVRLLALDPPVARRLAASRSLSAQLHDGALMRSRSLAVYAALTQLRRVEDRLRLLFWHLGERWGRVLDDGAIAITLPLTHEDLAHLVAARRPSVTTALGRLAEAGELDRDESTWRLRGSPPDAPAG